MSSWKLEIGIVDFVQSLNSGIIYFLGFLSHFASGKGKTSVVICDLILQFDAFRFFPFKKNYLRSLLKFLNNFFFLYISWATMFKCFSLNKKFFCLLKNLKNQQRNKINIFLLSLALFSDSLVFLLWGNRKKKLKSFPAVKSSLFPTM